jgi:hypothetical protein
VDIRNIKPWELEAARLLLKSNGWHGRDLEPVRFTELVARSQRALVAVEN